jgi:FkbM family methyltransferase
MSSSSMQASTKYAIKRWLRRAGLEVSKYARFRQFDERLIALMEAQRVGLVLDVGANTGQYALILRALGFRGRIVSFEPLEAPHRELAENAQHDRLWEVAPRCALGERSGVLRIQVSRNSLSSSALEILPAHLEAEPESAVVSATEVNMQTLDAAAGPFVRQDDRIFLKVDVQGMEEKVLAGAQQVLGRTVGLQVELSLTPLYATQPLLCDMVATLRHRGFALVDLEPEFVDPRSGRVLQANGLFLRT